MWGELIQVGICKLAMLVRKEERMKYLKGRNAGG
jgi:hypothetical protein